MAKQTKPPGNPPGSKPGVWSRLRKSTSAAFSHVFLGKDPWLTGGMPLTPKEPEGAGPRRFQYAPGYNIQISPRSNEAISFEQLKAMSDYTMVRVIIEFIKEALKAHQWDIVPNDIDQKGQYETEISAVKQFLEKPDRRQAWDEWLGAILEDLLTIDAVAIFKQRNRKGEIVGFEQIDGTTIKVLTTDRGFTPLGEAPAYQQFLYGVPYVNLTRHDLIYKPRNRRPSKFYGFSPVEQAVVTINTGIRRELVVLSQLTDGNIPAGLAGVPKDWSPEDIEIFQDYFDGILSGQIQNRSKIKFVPQGFDYTKFTDEDAYGAGASKFDENLARILCFAFGISPQAFIQIQSRAGSQEMGDNEAEYGLAAVKGYISKLMNGIIDNDFRMPFLQFKWITDRGRVVQKRVQRNVAYVAGSILTPNEVRAEEGVAPHKDGDKLMFSSGGAGDGAGTGPNLPMMPGAGQPDNMQNENRELQQWAKYAANRWKKSRDLIGAFKTNHIPLVKAREIRQELGLVKSLDAMRHLFERKRTGVKSIRLPGPESGDGQEFQGQLIAALKPILEREAKSMAGDRD